MPLNTDFNRGEIIHVSLNPIQGSEQGGERPALILSPAVINQNLTILLVALITSKRTERVFPTEVLIQPPMGGLSKPSKIMLYQLRSIDKVRVIGRYGSIDQATMARVETALKIATGLTVY